MAVTDIPVGNGNRIMFRASASTYTALALHGRRQGISPSVAARRILDEAVHKGTVEQTLDLLIDCILILDELVRVMLSDVEAEHFARLRAIDRAERR